MKLILLLLLLPAMVGVEAAQPARRNALDGMTRRSEAFTVIDLRTSPPKEFRGATNDPNWVRLDANFLLISAERVKQILYRALALPPQTMGGINLGLQKSELIPGMRLVSNYYPGRWRFDLEIPDRIERAMLIRGITHVLLTELANREAGPRSAELPLWLTEGLAGLVELEGGQDLIAGNVAVGSYLKILRVNPGVDLLKPAIETLRSHQPLTFAELSHPEPSMVAGDNLPVYRASAELFVHELLRSPGGRERLLRMLRELPSFWNWETAFLRAFNDSFTRMLDVEKWWSVNLTAMGGSDPSKIWTLPVLLGKLDDLLTSGGLMPGASDSLPSRSQVSLQQIVAEWEFSQQRPVLRQKVSQLTAMRPNTPMPAVALVERYRDVLHLYLQKREMVGYSPATKRDLQVNGRLLLIDTLRQLEALDQERARLRQSLEQASAPGETVARR